MRLIAFLIVGFIVITGVVQCSYLGDRMGCYSRWSDSGHESRFGVIAGCQVNVNGQWLPEKAFRSVQP